MRRDAVPGGGLRADAAGILPASAGRLEAGGPRAARHSPASYSCNTRQAACSAARDERKVSTAASGGQPRRISSPL